MAEKEKEKVESLKLDCREKAIFEKIVKEGNAGRVSLAWTVLMSCKIKIIDL